MSNFNLSEEDIKILEKVGIHLEDDALVYTSGNEDFSTKYTCYTIFSLKERRCNRELLYFCVNGDVYIPSTMEVPPPKEDLEKALQILKDIE